MKRAVAYCRVSTNKEEQLDSMESQQQFFQEYAKRNGYELKHIYADEGKSGTKIKNRTQLLQMLAEAPNHTYDLVLIKDVSRLARNTVDFLTSLRKLKSLGIKVIFVNYDQTSSESSEFMLTMLSAIAQEESANTSKRVKFGKRQNAEKGKVPNLVFGYDKMKGDYFNLKINSDEAKIVQRIYHMYTDLEMGAGRIAKELNQAGIKTKRGCDWTQCSIIRILTNELYIGKVINRKEEVIDFLTGARNRVKEVDRLITYRPQLQIIENAVFEKAAQFMDARKSSFHQPEKQKSTKQIFSSLVYCEHCGAAFRRMVRTYKNTYVRWVCGGRNSLGIQACINKTAIEEELLLNKIKDYMTEILKSCPKAENNLIMEYNRRLKNNTSTSFSVEDYNSKRNSLVKRKQKYMEMFQNDIITIKELQDMVETLDSRLKSLEKEAVLWEHNSRLQQAISNGSHITLESLLLPDILTNVVLKKIIRKITVDHLKNIDIFLKELE